MFGLTAVAAQDIPNPVRVLYGFRQIPRTYSVDCWSNAGIRGKWLPVIGSAYTTQEALNYTLKYPPEPRPLGKPSILYCLRRDGKPGIITGAPQGLLLARGSRVEVHATATILISYVEGGVKNQVAFSVPLDYDTRINSGPAGTIVTRKDHELTLYPSGAQTMFGNDVEVLFFPPGVAQPRADRVATGCTISYINKRGKVGRTAHDERNCPAVERDLLMASPTR